MGAWQLARASPAALAVVTACLCIAPDVATRRIPNRLTYPGLALVIALAGLAAGVGREPSLVIAASVGCLAAGLAFWLGFRAGGLGGGDVKLAAVIGAGFAPLGVEAWTLALGAGAACGGVLGAAAWLRARSGRVAVPLAPCLAAGAGLALAAHCL